MAEMNGVNGVSNVNGHSEPATSPAAGFETTIDFLIVGTGPAGGALACFLAQNGKQASMRDRLQRGCTAPLARPKLISFLQA
jgi:alkyl hydroperoxide reductase subunit AhpF